MEKNDLNTCARCGKTFKTVHSRNVFEGLPYHRCCLRWHKRDIGKSGPDGNVAFQANAERMMKFGGGF